MTPKYIAYEIINTSSTIPVVQLISDINNNRFLLQSQTIYNWNTYKWYVNITNNSFTMRNDTHNNAVGIHYNGTYLQLGTTWQKIELYTTHTIVRGTYSADWDIRLKKNIRSFNSSSLYKLNPVCFNWISNNKKWFGFIAQEVEKYIPELITNKEYKYLKYDAIIPFITKEIQKNKKNNIKTKNNINEINEKINKLKILVNNLL